MKIFNIIFCILFVLFAALQYNDPDPYTWIPIYMYAAVLCWFAFKGKYYPRAYIGGIVVYTLYALYKFFEKNGVWEWATIHHGDNIAGAMHAETPWIEDTREFFGLAILIIVLLIDYFYAQKKKVKA